MLAGKKRAPETSTVELQKSRTKVIERVVEEKNDLPFKNHSYFRKRGKINAKAVKNLKQMTVNLEDGVERGSCKSLTKRPVLRIRL